MNPAESGFYYLESRYYDPEIGRFINADGYVSTGKGLLGFNMFAYCNNNPVKYKDDAGYKLTTCVDDADPTNDFFDDVAGGGSGFYHHGVDLSIAARSSSWSSGILNCGYTQYSYSTPAYGKGDSQITLLEWVGG